MLLIKIFLCLSACANAATYSWIPDTDVSSVAISNIVDVTGSSVSVTGSSVSISGSVSLINGESNLKVDVTPIGELQVAEPSRLIGMQFVPGVWDSNFWNATITGIGASTDTTYGILVMNTGTTANNSVVVQSSRTARYVSGVANKYRSITQLPDAAVANNVMRWGVFTSSCGAFFQRDTVFKVCTRCVGTDVCVSSESFNGVPGTVLDTSAAAFEIVYTNTKVRFYKDDKLIHTYSVTTSTMPWAASMALPISIQNTNSGGGTSDVRLITRVASVTRLGKELTAPQTRRITSTAGTVLKYGPGTLHTLCVNRDTANAQLITIYDGTSAAGSIIAVVDTNTHQQCYPYEAPFFSGLFVVTEATLDNTFIYE